MTTIAATRQKPWRWGMLVGLGLTLAGSLNGCTKPAEPNVPSQPSAPPSSEGPGLPPDCRELAPLPDPPDDCWADHEADVLLARLAVSAFACYGRLDPWLLAPSADGASLSVAQNAIASDLKSSACALYSKTKDEVRKNDIAWRNYLIGKATAIATCGLDRCPNLAKRHTVTLREDAPDGDQVNYHFQIVDGPIPTLFEWEQGVMRQFTYLPPHCHYFGPALQIPDPEAITKDEAKATDTAKSDSASMEKPFETGAAYGEVVLGDSSRRLENCCKASATGRRKLRTMAGDPPLPVCRNACPGER